MFHFGLSGEMLLDYLVLTTFIVIWFCTLTLIPAIFSISVHMNSSPSYSRISSGTSWICVSKQGTLELEIFPGQPVCKRDGEKKNSFSISQRQNLHCPNVHSPNVKQTNKEDYVAFMTLIILVATLSLSTFLFSLFWHFSNFGRFIPLD